MRLDSKFQSSQTHEVGVSTPKSGLRLYHRDLIDPSSRLYLNHLGLKSIRPITKRARRQGCQKDWVLALPVFAISERAPGSACVDPVNCLNTRLRGGPKRPQGPIKVPESQRGAAQPEIASPRGHLACKTFLLWRLTDTKLPEPQPFEQSTTE